MQYRNKSTGTIIETGCIITGNDWEAILPPNIIEKQEAQPPVTEEKKTPSKPAARKTSAKQSTTRKPTTKKQVKK